LRFFAVIIITFAIIINIFSSDFDCGFKHSHENHISNSVQTADQQVEINFDDGHDGSDSDQDHCVNCNCLCHQKIAFQTIPIKFSYIHEEATRFFVKTFLKPRFIQLPERPPITC
jgi:hypothetical protein